MSGREFERVARETDAAVDEAKRRARQTGEAISTETPLDALLRAECGETAEEFEIKSEGFCQLIDYVFAKGPHPHDVMQRLYSVARSVRPEVTLNMPGRAIAAIFGQTRAAESARTKLLLTTTFEAAGFRASALPYQKSASGCQAYAEAQRGNTNRRGTGRKAKSRKASALRS